MKRKIMQYTILVSLLMIALSVILTFSLNYISFEQSVESQLRQESLLVSAGMEQENDDEQSYLNRLSGSVVDRVTWIDADGTVLFDNYADTSTMDNHLDRREVADAIENGTGFASRYSGTLSVKTEYYARKLEDGTILRIAVDHTSVFQLLYRLLLPLIGVLGLLIFLAAVLSGRIAKQAVRPINDIDLDHVEDTEPYEELSPLLTKISSQSRRIEEQVEQLQRQRREFEAITENMSEGFLIVDSHTNLLSYNSSAKRMLGVENLPEHETVLAINRSSGFRGVLEKALAGRHSQTVFQYKERQYQFLANPVRQHGQIVGAVILLMDVTERMEQEAMRREFTANVSHELKTPLTSISGYAEIIEAGIVKEEDISRFAGKIQEEAMRLLTLVNDILKISRLDEDVDLPEKESVDLYSLSEQILSRLQPQAEKRDIHMELSGDHESVLGQRQVLDDMVFNLCDNAIKYNKEQGSLAVRIQKTEEGICLSVQDTGVGIPYEHRDRIFERFYRVEKSHSKELGGTGLGLSIVKHGAQLHDAQIRVNSTVGQGTTITLIFPGDSNQG